MTNNKKAYKEFEESLKEVKLIKQGKIKPKDWRELLKELNDVTIPPYIRKEIGVSENWIEDISPKQRKLTFRIANRFKETLRKLSKN